MDLAFAHDPSAKSDGVTGSHDHVFTVRRFFINDGYHHEESNPVCLAGRSPHRLCQPGTTHGGLPGPGSQQGRLLYGGAESPGVHHERRREAGDGERQQGGQLSSSGSCRAVSRPPIHRMRGLLLAAMCPRYPGAQGRPAPLCCCRPDRAGRRRSNQGHSGGAAPVAHCRQSLP